MTMSILSKMIGEKKQYREIKARLEALPAGHRTAALALERYLLMLGPGTSDGVIRMLGDLADLFEQSAADGLPIRDVVGDDPVEFAETFLRNYRSGAWLTKERARLTEAVDEAERGGSS